MPKLFKEEKPACSKTEPGRLHIYTQDEPRSLSLTMHKDQFQTDQALSLRGDRCSGTAKQGEGEPTLQVGEEGLSEQDDQALRRHGQHWKNGKGNSWSNEGTSYKIKTIFAHYKQDRK